VRRVEPVQLDHLCVHVEIGARVSVPGAVRLLIVEAGLQLTFVARAVQELAQLIIE